jgi:hypothetical protein
MSAHHNEAILPSQTGREVRWLTYFRKSEQGTAIPENKQDGMSLIYTMKFKSIGCNIGNFGLEYANLNGRFDGEKVSLWLMTNSAESWLKWIGLVDYGYLSRYLRMKPKTEGGNCSFRPLVLGLAVTELTVHGVAP